MALGYDLSSLILRDDSYINKYLKTIQEVILFKKTYTEKKKS